MGACGREEGGGVEGVMLSAVGKREVRGGEGRRGHWVGGQEERQVKE